jgi:hypothetical protein
MAALLQVTLKQVEEAEDFSSHFRTPKPNTAPAHLSCNDLAAPENCPDGEPT